MALADARYAMDVKAAFAGAALAALVWAGQTSADAAFAKWWRARSPAETARLRDEIIRSGVSFDEAWARLRRGRPYSADVAIGTVTGVRSGEFPYTIEVPPSYDPTRAYGLRIYLHGGVGREAPREVRVDGRGRGAGATGPARGRDDEIVLLPSAWRDAPWWTDAQAENLHALVDMVKRTYHIDENRVVVTGVSDGATGAYYVAMRDPTPYAAFLPLNGFPLVLANPALGVAGDVYPNNLRNRPFFVVNGGRDRLYPAAVVTPYLTHLARGGVEIDYRPQPEAGHDTSWWPVVQPEFDAFVRAHPRPALPDRLTWETDGRRRPGRLHWLVINEIGQAADDAAMADDLNLFSALDVGFRTKDLRVAEVFPGTHAARVGLRVGDVVRAVNGQPVVSGTAIAQILEHYLIGADIRWTVERARVRVELQGPFDPQPGELPPSALFPRTGRSARVDVVRTGNTLTLTSRGVTAVTLLLSPDQFDFSTPIRVVMNGRTIHDGRVEKRLSTLLEWAALDNDRTMLFGAVIVGRVPLYSR